MKRVGNRSGNRPGVEVGIRSGDEVRSGRKDDRERGLKTTVEKRKNIYRVLIVKCSNDGTVSWLIIS